jgi:hypothetical protein
MTSLSRRLARWIVGLRYEHLPPDVIDRAKGVALHGLASALLGVFPAAFASELARSPFFAWPNPGFLSYGFEPSLMLPFAVSSPFFSSQAMSSARQAGLSFTSPVSFFRTSSGR